MKVESILVSLILLVVLAMAVHTLVTARRMHERIPAIVALIAAVLVVMAALAVHSGAL